MATLFTRREAIAAGRTDRQLEWAVERGRYIRIAQGVYFKADRPPTQFECRLATAMRGGAPVCGELAAALHGIDGFGTPLDGCYTNVPRVGVGQTLLALAPMSTDIHWEWALEWALRNREIALDEVEAALLTKRRGNKRIRRVLKLRPPGAPPTESLLETLMVQLIRTQARLPTPTRQLEVRNRYEEFVARIDLAWPEHGVFVELDGERHKDQPVYDANRQTRVMASMGWLVGRFSWTEVTCHQKATARKLVELFEMAELRRAGECQVR